MFNIFSDVLYYVEINKHLHKCILFVKRQNMQKESLVIGCYDLYFHFEDFDL